MGTPDNRKHTAAESSEINVVNKSKLPKRPEINVVNKRNLLKRPEDRVYMVLSESEVWTKEVESI
jgi:hypothetical protein